MREVPRDEWVLSTKVGRLLRPRLAAPAKSEENRRPLPFATVYDYSYDGIMRSVEDSLQRLGLARIDILYVRQPIPAQLWADLRGAGLLHAKAPTPA